MQPLGEVLINVNISSPATFIQRATGDWSQITQKKAHHGERFAHKNLQINNICLVRTLHRQAYIHIQYRLPTQANLINYSIDFFYSDRTYRGLLAVKSQLLGIELVFKRLDLQMFFSKIKLI